MAFHYNESFNKVWRELYEITVDNKNKLTITKLLEEANKLDYDETIPFFNQVKSSSLVARLVRLSSLFQDDHKSRRNIYDLMVALTSKQKINVTSSSVNLVLKLLHEHWHQDPPTSVLASLMNAISAVSYGNGPHIQTKFMDWLLITQNSVASVTISSNDFDVRKIGLQCLKGLCMMSASSQERLSERYLMHCCDVFFTVVQMDSSKTESSRYNLKFTAMRGIKQVFDHPGPKKVGQLETVFVALKNAASFGRLTNLVKLESLSLSSSSEDYSDSGAELLRDEPNRNKFACKYRQLALDCMLAIVRKTSKNNLFTYWHLLFHEVHGVSLLTCVSSDPLPKVRAGAAMVMTSLLESGKPYLALSVSQQSDQHSSFVSYASRMTQSVSEIHQTLINGLSKEPCSSVRNQLLKALSAACATTPYAKLRCGMINKLTKAARNLLTSSAGSSIQIAALNVFTTLLGNPSVTNEVVDSLKEKTISINGFYKSWLVDYCIGLCKTTTTTQQLSNSLNPLSVAGLQTLTAMSKSYFVLMLAYIDDMLAIAQQAAAKTNICFGLHVCKMIEGIGKGLASDAPLYTQMNIRFWQALLSGCLQDLLVSGDYSVASQVCDILSILGSGVYEVLSMEQRCFCTSSLLKLVNDPNYLVRSASVRCLAVYVAYPSLRRDDHFMVEVARSVLKLLIDPVKNVQTNAAWAFANLTDSLAGNKRFENELLGLMFERAFILLEAPGGKDKVRFNMMRVLGNLLRVLDERHTDDELFIDHVRRARTALIHALQGDKLMKVRWNACMALGNFLHNAHLPIGQPDTTNDVFQALIAILSNSSNFKVRIKAAAALACPRTRQNYGANLELVFQALIAQLLPQSNDSAAPPSADFNFEDKLQAQVVFTLLHINRLMTREDCVAVARLVYDLDDLEHVRRLVGYAITDARRELTTENSAVNGAHANEEEEGEEAYALVTLSSKEKFDLVESAAVVWREKMKKARSDCGGENGGNKKKESTLLSLFDAVLDDIQQYCA